MNPSRLRLLRNVIEMYTAAVLDKTTDGFYLEKYSATLAELKERLAQHAPTVPQQEKQNQLNLF